MRGGGRANLERLTAAQSAGCVGPRALSRPPLGTGTLAFMPGRPQDGGSCWGWQGAKPFLLIPWCLWGRKVSRSRTAWGWSAG